MKNLTFIFAFLFIGWSVSASVDSKPATTNSYSNYNDSFIFVEGGVEFAVYPNGEFDFYFNPDFRRGNSVHFSSPNVNISYNSGYNYDPYVQYDDYGAVIQIESVPIYYDYYGRIIQAGNIYMRYNNFGRLARVGNLHIHYDQHHHFSHYNGYINHYNRRYVYRPWHDYYRPPGVNVSIVFNRPYRAYYQPQRISYNKYVTVYNNYYVKNNRKRNFYRPSQQVRSYNYGKRTSSKRNIAYVKSRSDYNKANITRQSSARDNVYSERTRTMRSTGDNKSRVYSDRNDRNERNIARGSSVNKNSRISGGMNERSTNSKGRSTRIENAQQKRQISSRESSVRTPQRSPERKVQSRSTSRIERPSATNTNRTIQNSGRSSERNTRVERPTRQRSSSIQKRTTSGSSRSQAIRSKKSSRSQSSARNVNNRL